MPHFNVKITVGNHLLHSRGQRETYSGQGEHMVFQKRLKLWFGLYNKEMKNQCYERIYEYPMDLIKTMSKTGIQIT